MRKISTILLAATLVFSGLAAVVGSGGMTDSSGPDRQWVSYQGSSEDCQNWCQQVLNDNFCENGSSSHDSGLCTCDGQDCTS